MSVLVARTGRQQQRYQDGYRLLAGCIPFKYRYSEESSGKLSEKIVEGGWENDETVEEAAAREALEEAGVRGDLMHLLGDYYFTSKTLRDESSPAGLCKATMYALFVNEELECWPEQNLRQRSWLTVSEADECCRHSWMKKALKEGFSGWLADGMMSTMKDRNHLHSPTTFDKA
ncbi:Nudix hydrolase domain-containing protein [Heracleum sosnowskyi]|uniref:Nudix hydrolase domain-containing protein n=1 Tax=Heracleum sosnowskyi TaxID=360622 RepID=A0AAD8HGN1_9APIA|nr:Nudix hydrolase domain-containing protein [Heracleum sosnowskyi]